MILEGHIKQSVCHQTTKPYEVEVWLHAILTLEGVEGDWPTSSPVFLTLEERAL